ncbi:hypothetical protein, partial [Burkholderia sp. LMG 13014]|uniref:hypothetical protein n=1 Tax=Burkholderia sp. LMG 13014 TaxID=2709306 RepID=UPI0019669AC6
ACRPIADGRLVRRTTVDIRAKRSLGTATRGQVFGADAYRFADTAAFVIAFLAGYVECQHASTRVHLSGNRRGHENMPGCGPAMASMIRRMIASVSSRGARVLAVTRLPMSRRKAARSRQPSRISCAAPGR